MISRPELVSPALQHLATPCRTGLSTGRSIPHALVTYIGIMRSTFAPRPLWTISLSDPPSPSCRSSPLLWELSGDDREERSDQLPSSPLSPNITARREQPCPSKSKSSVRLATPAARPRLGVTGSLLSAAAAWPPERPVTTGSPTAADVGRTARRWESFDSPSTPPSSSSSSNSSSLQQPRRPTPSSSPTSRRTRRLPSHTSPLVKQPQRAAAAGSRTTTFGPTTL